MSLSAVVLAAGKGKRMKTAIPKVLHQVAGEPMIAHVLRAAGSVDADPVVVVVGHNGEQIEAHLNGNGHDVITAWQEKLLGTGDAVRSALPHIPAKSRYVLVLCGDAPLIRHSTLKHLIESHRERKPAITMLTAIVDDPSGYGRVIRDRDGFVQQIVEEVDATREQKKIKEINSGIYIFNQDILREGLENLQAMNNQNEYYLTDVIKYAVGKGLRVDAIKTDDPAEILGVNSRKELAVANHILYRRNAERLMENGVTVIDPSTTYIECFCEVGQDTVIYPGTFLRGKTVIGERCLIGPGCDIRDSIIGSEVEMSRCVVVESRIEDGVKVGPFAYLRPGTTVRSGAKVGTFVELKKTTVGKGSKVPHLSYMGDAEIGDGVNIGAGSITCNYDGFEKHRTIIEDDAFIGSDTMFVAPVRIGRGAFTGAGSVITDDVPEESLGIARARQVNKEKWAKKRRRKD